MKNINAIFLFLLLILLPFKAMSSGWPLPQGSFYIKLSEWWIKSNQHYTDVGAIDPNVTSGIYNTNLYAEYGLTNRFTVIAYVPVVSRSYMNNLVSSVNGEVLSAGEAINTIGDADLSLKYGLIRNKPVVVAATLTLGLPLGNSAGGISKNLQTGDGEFNQMIKLDASTSFGSAKLPMYANIYSGFNNRTKGYSDEFRYGAELGAAFFEKKIWLTGRLTGIKSFKNGETAATNRNATIFSNNSEFVSGSIEAAYYITKKVGISVGYASAFSGKLIFAAPSYSVGIFLDMK